MVIAQSLKERLLKIKVVLIDNDGVLTDGRIVYGDYGDELKFFDVQDGFGMTLLHHAGIPFVIVSGKKVPHQLPPRQRASSFLPVSKSCR